MPQETPAAPATPLPRRLCDARPDRLDFRDLPYRPPLRSLPRRWPDDAAIARHLPGYVAAGLVLDQGTEGACTGFGLACVANYLLWVRHQEESSAAPFESVSPRMLYELARRYDEWPGEDYEGSSCRGALKGWHKHGACSLSLWPYPLDDQGRPVFAAPREGWERDAARRTIGVYYRVDRESVVDVQAAIAEIGAVFVSADVHDGWQGLARAEARPAPRRHDDLRASTIAPLTDARSLGGHAFALVGYNEHGFIVQNSWSTRWGASGFALLPYADWIEHATDVWACALGVPADPGAGGRSSSRWPGKGRGPLVHTPRGVRAAGNPADDPWPIDREFLHAPYRPWCTDEAYGHTLVSGNDGELCVGDVTHDPRDRAGYARRIALEGPLAWTRGRHGPLKLAIYAHGGLNDEAESIARIRVLAPCFAANGIYPLFLTWRTGIGETLGHMAEDWWRGVAGEAGLAAGDLGDRMRAAADRALEAVARRLGRGVWSEMRENAQRGAAPEHALDLLARHLVDLARAQPGLELHLVGHSAGALLLGHLVERLLRSDRRPTAPRIASCSLFAPACSVRFAVDRYLVAADAGLLDRARLRVHCLSDANEKADGLPSPEVAAYGKSLLYLVARALEDRRKMPLLGLERAVVPGYEHDTDRWCADELPAIQEWQRRAPPARVLAAPYVTTTRTGVQARATHGSFDNNIALVTETLELIRGAPLAAPLEWLDY